MKCVFKEMWSYKKELLFIILTTIGTTMATLTLPTLLSILIDRAYYNNDIMLVIEIGAVMIAIVAFGLWCGVTTSRLSATVSMGVGRNLRSKVFRKVQYFSQTEIDKFTASSLITRTNNDISQIQTFLNQCLRIAIQAPVMCICGIILAISSSPSLSGVLIVSIPVMCVVLVIIAKMIPQIHITGA